MVRLPGLSDRKPVQLSGGQRQRVALARAIVNEPEVLLLDEPLGALDLKLRQEMQLELKRIQREVGITFIYVTHDQEEALTMSDRLAVFNLGRIEQLGTPEAVYEKPASEFVAGFIGVSNLLERGGRRFTIRPEKIRLLLAEGEQPPAGSHAEPGRIEEATYLGMVTRYVVELTAGGRLTAVAQNLETAAAEALAARGRAVTVAWRDDQTYEIQDHPGRALQRHRMSRRRTHETCGPERGRSSPRRPRWRWPPAAPRHPAGRRRPAHRAAARPSGLTAPEASAPVPSSVGKTEGHLNLIAWEGYAQPQWVKPYEQATGCQVSVKYAGSSSEMVSLMANGGGGQYDLVSASGDADLRLIYGGDVRPINISLIPSWKNFHPFLQSPPFNTIGGKHYGVSYEFGPNVLLYSKAAFPTAPTSWSVLYSKKYAGQITVPGQPDPDRRRRALSV